MNERLLDSDLQRGRKLLMERVNSPEDVESLRQAAPDDYDLVNRALAMFELFALYVRRGYVDKDIVLEEWGHTFARTAKRGEHVIEHRAEFLGYYSWPNLREFGREAAEWVAKVESDHRWVKALPAADSDGSVE